MPIPRLHVVAMAALAAWHAAVPAATRTWDGNGGSDNWSFIDGASGNTNWTDKTSPGQPLPFNGDALVFGAAARLTPNNDLAGLSIAGISFKSGAGAYTLNGLGISSTRDIVNSSQSRQTIDMPISIAADQVWRGDIGGLQMNGGLTLNTHALTLDTGTQVSTSQPALYVGYFGGNASLTLRNAATLTSLSAHVGDGQADTGSVRLGGSGTRWTVGGELLIGPVGHGSVQVADQAQLASQGGGLGLFTGGVGALDIGDAGSVWHDTGTLYLGDHGSGAVTIHSGGQAALNAVVLGQNTGSSGSLSVDGAGSKLTLAGALLPFGQAGSASVDVTNGGQLVASGAVLLGGPSPSIKVSGAGSLFEADGGLSLGAGSLLSLSAGRLATSTLSLAPGARFQWTGGEFDTGNLTVGTSGLLGNAVTLNADQALGLSGDLTVNGGAMLQVAAGASLSAGTYTANGGSAVVIGGSMKAHSANLYGSGTTLLLDGASFSADRWTLNDRVVIAGGRIVLQDTQSLLGGGTVTLNSGLSIAGSAKAIFIGSGVPGAVVLGGAGSDGAVDDSGLLWLSLGAHMVIVSPSVTTVHGAIRLDDGTSLYSDAGIHLFAGASLNASNASVDGNFANDGSVVGQGLSFLGNVSGSGSFSGSIDFQGRFDPGSGVARVGFGHGATHFDSSAVVTLDIGAGHDELADIGALQFDGRLVLAFGNGFVARPGQRIALLDFDSFAGSLDAGRVTVQGFDAARLDLSRLGIDGSIAVTPVPEPAPALLLAAGLAALRLRTRRPSA